MSRREEGHDAPLSEDKLLEWLRGFGVDGKVDAATLRRLIRQREFDAHPEDVQKWASEAR